MDPDESQSTDLIAPHRFMGWETEGLIFLVWTDNVYKVQMNRKREHFCVITNLLGQLHRATGGAACDRVFAAPPVFILKPHD